MLPLELRVADENEPVTVVAIEVDVVSAEDEVTIEQDITY